MLLKLKSVLNLACMCICFVGPVFSGSYWGDLIVERPEGNRVREYCETREGLKIFKGSVVKFRDCFVCTCDDEGLDCKTPYGILLGGYPNSCKPVIDDCKTLLVDAKNNFLHCLTLIPTNQANQGIFHVEG